MTEWFTTPKKQINKPAVKLDEKYGRFMFNKELGEIILDKFELPQMVNVGLNRVKKIIQIKINVNGNLKLTMATKKIVGIHCKPVITWLLDNDDNIKYNCYYNAEFNGKDLITIFYE